MFDANMRFLPKGRDCFADVYSCPPSSELFKNGVRCGDVVLFHMEENGNENPLVTIRVPSNKNKIKLRAINSEAGVEDSWLVYAGNLDLTGFMNNRVGRESKSKATKVLLRLWVQMAEELKLYGER